MGGIRQSAARYSVQLLFAGDKVRYAPVDSCRFAGTHYYLNCKVDIYSVVDGPFDLLPFFKDLGCWGRDCAFERQIQTACDPAFAKWHNVEMFAAAPSDSGPLFWVNSQVLVWLRVLYEAEFSGCSDAVVLSSSYQNPYGILWSSLADCGL